MTGTAGLGKLDSAAVGDKHFKDGLWLRPTGLHANETFLTSAAGNVRLHIADAVRPDVHGKVSDGIGCRIRQIEPVRRNSLHQVIGAGQQRLEPQ